MGKSACVKCLTQINFKISRVTAILQYLTLDIPSFDCKCFNSNNFNK